MTSFRTKSIFAAALLRCCALFAVAALVAGCVVEPAPLDAYYDGSACCYAYYEYPYYRRYRYEYPHYIPYLREEQWRYRR